MRRLIVPGLTSGRVRLPPDVSHHLLHVLRARPGAILHLGDGTGTFAEATLVGADGAVAIAEVGPLHRALPSPVRIVLLGLPKPALAEEAVTLGTELGATAFRVLRARYSPPAEPRMDRLGKVAGVAATQCGRAEVPPIAVCRHWDEALAGLPTARFVATPGAPAAAPCDADLVVAIGPEGGFSPEEQARLAAAGFLGVGLGPNILRAPTAVAVALATLERQAPPAGW